MHHLLFYERTIPTTATGENYKPSSELLATFATLPRHLLSASSSASTAPRNPAGDYTPSHELLATFATLPAHLLSQGGMSQDTKPLKQEETSVFVP